MPQEATLEWAYEHSGATGRVLGQRREWEVRERVGLQRVPREAGMTGSREYSSTLGLRLVQHTLTARGQIWRKNG